MNRGCNCKATLGEDVHYPNCLIVSGHIIYKKDRKTMLVDHETKIPTNEKGQVVFNCVNEFENAVLYVLNRFDPLIGKILTKQEVEEQLSNNLRKTITTVVY